MQTMGSSLYCAIQFQGIRGEQVRMAKVQGKKAATSAKKKAAAKTAARPKSSKKPAPKKPAAKPKPALKKKAAKPAPAKKKPAPKKKVAPSKKAAPKKAAPKPAAKKASPKTVAKPAAKPAPKPKPAPKAEKPADSKLKSAVKTVAKVAAGVVAGAVVARVVPPSEDKKKRRSRPRVTSSGPATAAWFSQGDRPRSSSFIPAPPRAEAPSLVAAPPASSDRLVGSHELTEFVVRTVPVRIDIESNGGRIYLTINPNDTTLKVGEGIEWDFRYLGGADVVIEEMIIEFAKPSPFPTTIFRSRRPGAARPHRQLSGPAQVTASGKTIQYTVRAFNAFKTEMAVAQPVLMVS
jgi:adenylate kinase